MHGICNNILFFVKCVVNSVGLFISLQLSYLRFLCVYFLVYFQASFHYIPRSHLSLGQPFPVFWFRIFFSFLFFPCILVIHFFVSKPISAVMILFLLRLVWPVSQTLGTLIYYSYFFLAYFSFSDKVPFIYFPFFSKIAPW